ncbi:type I glyceraldehyde-3-phosphate dehydrogenase [Flavobacteriales bacterium]|jgi:glyceraldehyde 3-phosphate dehydrogenase|nr:type I glyceraldehyde-3-phosphate dehydrogenase [Flavobacteriales bacterium]MDB2362682.1 type I glyceraldehyde-3-phosphate dehydrogenase [Flavobacteriales bacterium]
MTKIKVAINGFGRIGRSFFRQSLQSNDIEIVAINDLTDVKTLAHLLKYDSTHGVLPNYISCSGDSILVDTTEIPVYSCPNPQELPWKEVGVDVVLECTGRFLKNEQALQHVIAGAKKVIVSAPSPDAKTVVLGVNDDIITEDDFVFSNASCTTNCLAPLAKVLNDNFGIKSGYITTTHAFTADQSLQDMPHKDLRRARSAMNSIIPTKTGAASAVGKVLPQLNGKLDGIALRVPVACGSITDFVCVVDKETTRDEVNKVLQDAADGPMKGILALSSDPLVSIDIVGRKESSIVDTELTKVDGNLVKLVSWYDNESGYSARLIDLCSRVLSLNKDLV